MSLASAGLEGSSAQPPSGFVLNFTTLADCVGSGLLAQESPVEEVAGPRELSTSLRLPAGGPGAVLLGQAR